MAEATYQVAAERPDLGQSLAKSSKSGKNIPVSVRGFNPDDIRPTDDVKVVYFFNIAPVEHRRSLPPNHPRDIIFPACPRGQAYVLAHSAITHPFTEFREDQNNNRFPVYTDGYREATKILCPLNPGTDQDWDDTATIHGGGNLCRLGVFWSVNNPPLPAELKAARKRLEQSYRAKIEEMVEIEASDGQDEARRRADKTAHAAAEYFEQSFSWHRSDLSQKRDGTKVDCAACGEKIQPTARICKECGAPTDPKLLDSWLADKFGAKSKPGRPKTFVDPDHVVES
ncbi:MAG: hypothetical protein ACLGXA_24425 [Acidobacteriota bacterium]